MKAENWPQLVGELTDHMANVRRVFNELIGDDEADTPQEEERSEPWREVWQDALQEDDSTPVLAHLADEERRQVLTLIADFRKELDKRPIGPRGRKCWTNCRRTCLLMSVLAKTPLLRIDG